MPARAAHRRRGVAAAGAEAPARVAPQAARAGWRRRSPACRCAGTCRAAAGQRQLGVSARAPRVWVSMNEPSWNSPSGWRRCCWPRSSSSTSPFSVSISEPTGIERASRSSWNVFDPGCLTKTRPRTALGVAADAGLRRRGRRQRRRRASGGQGAVESVSDDVVDVAVVVGALDALGVHQDMQPGVRPASTVVQPIRRRKPVTLPRSSAVAGWSAHRRRGTRSRSVANCDDHASSSRPGGEAAEVGRQRRLDVAGVDLGAAALTVDLLEPRSRRRRSRCRRPTGEEVAAAADRGAVARGRELRRAVDDRGEVRDRLPARGRPERRSTFVAPGPGLGVAVLDDVAGGRTAWAGAAKMSGAAQGQREEAASHAG